MDNIFKQLFRYGFHDTDLTSLLCENGQIYLSFNNGIYILDENGKEQKLSKAIQIVLEIDTSFYSLDQLLEIKEYGNKVKYLNYSVLKKYFEKETYGICMAYYSNFNNCILFDGGICGKQIMISIEGIKTVRIK